MGTNAIDCSARNMSETGAALDVASSIGLPRKFMLIHVAGRKLCEVVWRKKAALGLASASFGLQSMTTVNSRDNFLNATIKCDVRRIALLFWDIRTL